MIDEKATNLEGLMGSWLQDFKTDLPFTYFQNVVRLREAMGPDVPIKNLPDLSYKRFLLELINKKYNLNLSFSDAELIQNRTKDNMKVTKNIKRAIDLQNSYTYHSIVELDYFNKPRYENNKYYITADPIEIVHMYSGISTCLSPGGENQGVIFELLASPYYYMLTDIHDSIRLNLYIDHENKVVFMNSIYGSYDQMAVFSVIRHFVSEGYQISKHARYFLGGDDLQYIDNWETPFTEEVKIMGYDFLSTSEDDRSRSTNIHKIPKSLNFEKREDFITGIYHEEDYLDQTTITRFWSSSYAICHVDYRFCPECSSLVDEYDFDEDAILCYECSNSYCFGCGEYYEEHNMATDFGTNICMDCLQYEYPEDYERIYGDNKESERADEINEEKKLEVYFNE